jgi:hypothetical protein
MKNTVLLSSVLETSLTKASGMMAASVSPKAA